MKRKLLIPLLALMAAPALYAQAPITINLGEPGYYGPVEIDDYYPKPRLMYNEPRVMDEAHRTGRPLYLHIPPGHAKDWDKHCKHYDACDRPAYFVEDSWYSDEYVPAYQKRRSEKGMNPGQGKGQGHDKNHEQGHDMGHDQDHDMDDDMDHDQDHDQKQGKGQSKDKTKDKDRDQAQYPGQGQGQGKNKDKDKDRDEDS